MSRKPGKSLKFSYHKTEEEKYRERRAKKPPTPPIRKKYFSTGFKFPMGAFLVRDESGNIYFGRIDPVTKKILSVCMIKNTKKETA